MSKIGMSLRIVGDFSTEALSHMLQTEPTKAISRGQQISKSRFAYTNVWLIDFFNLEYHRSSEPLSPEELDANAFLAKELLRAKDFLKGLAVPLATLDRSKYKPQLYISTVRYEDQGGFSLPSELISAAAECGLSLEVSILVVLDEDPE